MTARVRVALLSFAFLAVSIQGIRAENREHVKQVRDTGSCKSCDLTEANLSGAIIEGGDLTDSNLTGAKLYKARLGGAELSNALFKDADLSGADLTGAKNANLTGAKTDGETVCPNGMRGPC